MALTKNARNKLFKLVQQSKKLLYQEITEQLQHHYGIFADSGKVLLVEELTTSEADVIHKAKLLRDRLKYLASNLADKKDEATESIEQLIREQAFTILNRLAALRMAEERGIVRETISKGYTSEGFQVYDSITGQGGTTSTYIRYKWYLNAVFDELALDLPSIFDRFSPYAIIFPGERSLLEMLNLINDEELIAHREEGFSAINLWQQDETIGWIYQYYNGREEISVMREASTAPRNSRELAVRNQFFTPRYVVQFLSDNSLGKIWYEMTKGNTRLKDTCPYLIKHSKELFLNKGEHAPLESESDVQYIEHREIKDPREIKMLDPACGSMHFGLYAFDLMEIIYQEAWDNHQELLTDLKNSMTRADYMNQIPEFIIRYNIHGVDIDPRALQIAALSLWLRAQKSFDKLKIEPSKRPQIKKSNLVLAEPMPVNQEFLSELVKPLDAPMRKLVLEIWDLMKLAGETGLLLRIEHEIDNKIQEIAKGLSDESKKSQITIGADEEQLIAAEQSSIYATKKYRTEFLDNAEKQVLDILKLLSENSDNGNAYQKLLFAEDSARGFAFIEMCRSNYDVIVMNPPFGAGTNGSLEYLKLNYPECYQDIFACFVNRMISLLNDGGSLGTISNRTAFFITSFKTWRDSLFDNNYLTCFCDLGSGVLDALVETASYVIQKGYKEDKSLFIDLLSESSKEDGLLDSITNNKFKYYSWIDFKRLPNHSISHWIKDEHLSYFKNLPKFYNDKRFAVSGITSGDDFRFFRNWWEISDVKGWIGLAKGGEYSPYVGVFNLMINWRNEGKEVKSKSNSYVRSEEHYFKPGITWSRRTSSNFSARILPKNFIFADKGPSVFCDDIWTTLQIMQSPIFGELINIQVAAGDQAARSYEVGIVNSTPVPKLKKQIEQTAIKELVSKLYYINSFNEASLFYSGDVISRLGLEWKNHLIKSIDELNSLDFSINNNLIAIYETKEEYQRYDYGKQFQYLLNEKENCEAFLSNLFGRLFNRWNNKSLGETNNSIESFLTSNEHNNKYINFDYANSTEFIFIDNGDNEFERKIEAEFSRLNIDYDTTFNYLNKYLGIKSIKEYFLSPTGFFEYHIKKYTFASRLSPIYIPVVSSHGSVTIFIYLLKFNNQTLYKIINNCIKPKIDILKNDLRTYLLNDSLDNKINKEIEKVQNTIAELETFEAELINISKYPYEPNNDDGSLITCAPLYKFFKNNKWRKASEETWKELEKGDYDWAHLAYSIWPERVAKKCKKDYSMAIAHSLENICENKPKEKKEKVKKAPKETKKNLKLNLE
jgi:hypothetical protein